MKRLLNIEREDLNFTSAGDFSLRSGDLENTARYNGLGFIQEVEIRIKSSYGDWYFEINKGANLSTFEGRMVNTVLIQNIKESIRNCLTQGDFLTTSDFDILAQQVDVDEVAVKLVFSDNVNKYIDYRIQDVRIIFDLKSATPRIVRS